MVNYDIDSFVKGLAVGRMLWRLDQASPPPPDPAYICFSSTSNFTIGFANDQRKSEIWDGRIEYSLDGDEWNAWTYQPGDTPPNIVSTDKTIYFRGTNNTIVSADDTYDDGHIAGQRFIIIASDPVECFGSIEALLDYTTVANRKHPIMGVGAFRGLFSGCNRLVSAPMLPSSILSNYAYYNMFYGCTSLVAAPELPASVVPNGAYWAMFAGCTSLVTAPTLVAASIGKEAYRSMFAGCSSLTTAPSIFATSLANVWSAMCCYRMFYRCTSLRALPLLYALYLSDDCYSQMFLDCPNVRISTVQSSSYPYAYRIPSIGDGSGEAGATDSMFKWTGGPFTGDPSINTTYYTDHQPV